MRPARGFVQIVLVALIALAIGAGAMFAYQKYFKTAGPFPLPTNIPEAESSPSPNPSPKDETANWKTYTDSNLKFSIKYPEEVKIRRIFPEGGIEFGIGKSADPNYVTGDKLSILFRGNAGTDPLTIFQTTECPKKGDLPCDEKTSAVKINNATGITTLGPNYPDKNNYYLTNGGKTVPVVRVYYNPADEQPNTEIFEQILSTFKFTE